MSIHPESSEPLDSLDFLEPTVPDIAASDPLDAELPDGFVSSPHRDAQSGTGDEAAWAGAEQHLNNSILQARMPPTMIHELATRRYLGAVRQGNVERAEQAALEMEAGHTDRVRIVREQALQVTFQAQLDAGDVAAAEQAFTRLLDYDQSVSRSVLPRHERENLMFQLMQGHLTAGNQAAAGRVFDAHVTPTDLTPTLLGV